MRISDNILQKIYPLFLIILSCVPTIKFLNHIVRNQDTNYNRKLVEIEKGNRVKRDIMHVFALFSSAVSSSSRRELGEK